MRTESPRPARRRISNPVRVFVRMMKRVRERGTRSLRGRIALAGGLVVAITLFAGGLAFAASETIIAQSDDGFSAATYTADQGEVVPLQVSGDSHNATARQNGPDGQALFRSPTISSGSAGVQGTQYLSAGDYAFYCSVHLNMVATLHVTSNGTPQARPSSSIKLTRRSVSQTIKKGLKLNMTPTTRIEGVTLTAKLGKATIGKKTTTLAEGFNAPVVKLSKAGKSKLRGKSSAKVSVTADIPFGSPVTGKAKLG
jgi:plastocyanin